jgi:hypothetical protein
MVVLSVHVADFVFDCLHTIVLILEINWSQISARLVEIWQEVAFGQGIGVFDASATELVIVDIMVPWEFYMILTNLRCCGIYLFVYDTVMLYKLLSIISSRSFIRGNYELHQYNCE